MDIRWKYCVYLLLTVLVAATATGQRERDFSKVEIEAVPVAAGVYMLIGEGGNIGLSVGEDGAFLIDDQYAPLTEKIEAAIDTITEDPVRFLINTHWHGDHTGGNENFGKRGSIVVAHANVRKRMSEEQFRELLDRRTPASPTGALPRITFTDEVTFHWNGDTIRIFHVPHAHTDGDSIIFFAKANVIHMGDTFFRGRYPFIDVDSGGDINGVIAAANSVLALSNSETKIIPGHGGLATPADLQVYRDMLTTVRDRIQTMINDGKSVDEVLAARPTKEFDAELGSDPERFVRLSYHGLAK